MYEFRISWVVPLKPVGGRGVNRGRDTGSEGEGRGQGTRRTRRAGKWKSNEEGRAPLEYLPRGPRISTYATDNVYAYIHAELIVSVTEIQLSKERTN